MRLRSHEDRQLSFTLFRILMGGIVPNLLLNQKSKSAWFLNKERLLTKGLWMA